MSNTTSRKNLGKGLAAILQAGTSIENQDEAASVGFLPDLDVNQIVPNPKQPRSQIKPEDLVGLADSIREYGVIEPLIVTKLEDGKYQLVAGERRWRAAKLAQLNTVPALIKEATTQKLLEIAIIENIQRKDLNPIEEAMALSELYKTYRVKLEDIAKKIGRETSTVSNKMRLLKLPDIVQQGLLEEKITESHAYVILSLKSVDAILAAYNIIVKKQLNVRQAEALIRKISLANRQAFPSNLKQNAIIYDEHIAALEEKLRKTLGQGVKLVKKRTGGRITVPFMSDKQLDALSDFLVSDQYTKYSEADNTGI